MDGTIRSNLRPGMQVAIVLKEDQGTGKRTIGEISAILTPSAEHHRGIKVRLKDGQVGRVQEILPKASPQVRPPPRKVPEELHLGILLLRSKSAYWYFRSHQDQNSGEIVSLGLDFPISRDEFTSTVLTAKTREALQQYTPEDNPTPQMALQLSFDLITPRLYINVYFAEASEVLDPESAAWSRSGWMPGSEVQKHLQNEELSPESQAIAEALLDQNLLK